MTGQRTSKSFKRTGSVYNLKMYPIEEKLNDAEPYDSVDLVTERGPAALRNRALNKAKFLDQELSFDIEPGAEAYN